MTTRVHGLTQAHMNRLVEQIEAVEGVRNDQLGVDAEALSNGTGGEAQTEEIWVNAATAL